MRKTTFAHRGLPLFVSSRSTHRKRRRTRRRTRRKTRRSTRRREEGGGKKKKETLKLTQSTSLPLLSATTCVVLRVFSFLSPSLFSFSLSLHQTFRFLCLVFLLVVVCPEETHGLLIARPLEIVCVTRTDLLNLSTLQKHRHRHTHINRQSIYTLQQDLDHEKLKWTRGGGGEIS